MTSQYLNSDNLQSSTSPWRIKCDDYVKYNLSSLPYFVDNKGVLLYKIHIEYCSRINRFMLIVYIDRQKYVVKFNYTMDSIKLITTYVCGIADCRFRNCRGMCTYVHDTNYKICYYDLVSTIKCVRGYRIIFDNNMVSRFHDGYTYFHLHSDYERYDRNDGCNSKSYYSRGLGYPSDTLTQYGDSDSEYADGSSSDLRTSTCYEGSDDECEHITKKRKCTIENKLIAVDDHKDKSIAVDDHKDKSIAVDDHNEELQELRNSHSQNISSLMFKFNSSIIKLVHDKQLSFDGSLELLDILLNHCQNIPKK